MEKQKLKSYIKKQAYNLGFDAVRIVSPDAIPEAAPRLRHFLAQNYHGDMEWLATYETRRKSPLALWADVKSIIMLGVNYGPKGNPLDRLACKMTGNISVYARGRDYHHIVKKKLKQLAHQISKESPAQLKVFVDTAPILEKPLAAAAGLGWQGKHTNLVSRDFGSWLFIGSIFTTAKLAPDRQEEDYCGTCRACLDICPSNAFPKAYQLDARRCISYLTIEAKHQVPLEFRSLIGNRIYGCDDCLAICPWNKYAKATHEAKLRTRAALHKPALTDLAKLDDVAFRALFAASPIKRTGRDRFVRNVLIALGNAGKQEAVPHIKARLCDTAPLVRGMAVWALAQYKNADEMKSLAQAALPSESDMNVRAEWERYI
ncbi:MAG: tRNA epoxyqueuosine(34) reductase QueG [Alphaproteobacteria bacterium]|nr:tRNA epoxyqueuosine(34) reductase QueG [Alphaproteobacteria bacterium]